MPQFAKSTRGKRALEVRYDSEGIVDGHMSKREKRERFVNRGLVSSAVYSKPDMVRGNARAHVHFPKVRLEFKSDAIGRFKQK